MSVRKMRSRFEIKGRGEWWNINCSLLCFLAVWIQYLKWGYCLSSLIHCCCKIWTVFRPKSPGNRLIKFLQRPSITDLGKDIGSPVDKAAWKPRAGVSQLRCVLINWYISGAPMASTWESADPVLGCILRCSCELCSSPTTSYLLLPTHTWGLTEGAGKKVRGGFTANLSSLF